MDVVASSTVTVWDWVQRLLFLIPIAAVTYFIRRAIVYFSPSIELEVLGEPTIQLLENIVLDDEPPVAVYPPPPPPPPYVVQLRVRYLVRSTLKVGFWRQFLELVEPKVAGVVICRLIGDDLNHPIRFPEVSPPFASKKGVGDVRSAVVFECDFTLSDEPLAWSVQEVVLSIDRRWEKRFTHRYAPSEGTEIAVRWPRQDEVQ